MSAEKLTILKETGLALLASLGTTKKVLATPGQKPGIFNDPAFTKLLAAAVKKFPDVDLIEKAQGYDQLLQKSKIFFPELEPFYYFFVDSFSFREHALQTLTEMGGETVEMKIETNPTLLVAFMDIFKLYVQIVLIIHDISERKQLLAVFSKLYKAVKFSEEPSYSKVSNWIQSLDTPIKSLQTDFKSLTNFLGKTLVDLAQTYNTIRGIALLRKNGTLNIGLRPEELQKPVTDKLRFQLIFSEDMYLWLIYGFLLCPDCLPLPGALELNCTVIREGYVLPVFHNATVQLAVEFENIWTSSKNKTFQQAVKQKKIKIKDVIDESAFKSSILHKSRRSFIKQELYTLFSMFQDTPALSAPKFQIALSGLALAKEEILWYFRHNSKEAKNSKRFPKLPENEFNDHAIVELISVSFQLKELLLKNRNLITSYYIEYLKGADTTALTELLDSSFKESVPAHIYEICNDILSKISKATSDSDFRTLRLNWLRAECSLSSIKSPVKLSKHQNLLDRMQLIVWHTKYSTEFDELLDTYTSLKSLWYWKDLYSDIFERAIKSNYAYLTHSLLQVLSDFPANGTIYNPTEREEIGKQILHLADEYLSLISKRVVDLTHALVKTNLEMETKLEDVNAVISFQIKRPEWKPPTKNWTPPPLPGTESEFKERKNLSKEAAYQKNLTSLLGSLQKTQFLDLWNTELDLTAYLIESLSKYIKSWIRNQIVTQVPDEKHKEVTNAVFTRPSIFLRQLTSFLSSFVELESYIDFDTSHLLRETLLGEIHVEGFGQSGTLDWVNADETEMKFGKTLLGQIIEFYKTFLEKHLLHDSQGVHVIWSDLNQCFYSKTGHSFRAEFYTDANEMKALCQVIGSYGARALDREILKFILKHVASLKEFLIAMRTPLTEFIHNYKAEQTTTDTLKKMKQLDQFLNISVAIGNALKFREILYKGLKSATETTIPLIYQVINSASSQYKPQIFKVPELLPSECLSSEIGNLPERGDPALKNWLAKGITKSDEGVWDLLPVAYAAGFTSNFWKQALYKPSFGAHGNGANVLSTCISTLLMTTKSLTINGWDSSPVLNQFTLFLEISSVLLLRMGRNSKPEKHGPVDYSSVITFLDQFTNESPLVSHSQLNDLIPYSKLRTEWRQIYSVKGKNMTTQDQF